MRPKADRPCYSCFVSKCCCCCFASDSYNDGWFNIKDGIGECTILDVSATFCPRSQPIVAMKLLLTLYTLTLLAASLTLTENPEFFFAYFAHWALAFSTVYMMTSLINSCFIPLSFFQPSDNISIEEQQIVPQWIRFTWVMSEISLHMCWMAATMFWCLEYDARNDDLSYQILMSRGGGLSFLVFIDVIILNCIPIRPKHWVFCFQMYCLFVLWSGIHAYFDIGNPNEFDNDPLFTNDDAIYRYMAWKYNWKDALIITIVWGFIISPALFSLMWLLSLYSFPCNWNGSHRRCIIIDPSDIASVTTARVSNKNHLPHEQELNEFGGLDLTKNEVQNGTYEEEKKEEECMETIIL